MVAVSRWYLLSLLFLVSACVTTAGEGNGEAVPPRAVTIGGVAAQLLTPAAPRASLILLAGADGALGITHDGTIHQLTDNQLVRTRQAYAARGFAVLVPEGEINLRQAVSYMAAITRPVTVVATSRGTLRAAQGLAAGARPERLVLSSGLLSDDSGSATNVVNTLGSPAALPPTLVIHHRQDACILSKPAGVQPFLDWAGGRATVLWLEGGQAEGKPCKGGAYHGFHGIDPAVVAAVARFALEGP